MNGNELLDIVGKIDPKLVQQAQKPPVIRWIALAACLALVIGITAMLLHPGASPTPSNPVLQAPTEPSPTVPSIPTTSSVPTIPTYTTTPPPETTLPTQTTPTTPPTYEELYRQLFREYYRTRPYGQPDDEVTVVDELLDKYNLYQLTAVFCDYEQVYDDMSEYLTDSQKDDYDHFQYRITCCQSAEEIHAHTARFLDPSLIDRTPDKRLFRDGEGKLHLMVTPTAVSGYDAFYVMNCSDTQMIVFAEEGYDEYEESAIILLELQNDTWLIRSVLPFDNHDNVESYRYLFEEIPADVDPQAYGMLLSDALFVNPDSFLKQLYTQNRETVLSIADLMYHTAIDPLLYQRLLDALDDRTDLTAEQRSALAMLQAPNEPSQENNISDYLTKEDGKTYLILPISKNRVYVWDQHKAYLKKIDINLLQEAEKSISNQTSKYPNNSGFYLQVDHEYLCLYLEIIVYIEPPESGMAGCGIDHEHLFFHEIITREPLVQPEVYSFSFAEDWAQYPEGTPGVKHSGFKNTTFSLITNGADAIAQAESEVTIDWNTTKVYYDSETKYWMVLFYTKEYPGGCQSIYMDWSGKTLLIVSGE